VELESGELVPVKRRKRRRKLATSSTSFERHIRLFHHMLRCPAWKSMRPQSKTILLDVWERHNGQNNGQISYGVREAAEIGIGKNVAGRALVDLQERGFLKLARGSCFDLKTKEARLWTLTMEKVGDEKPTKEFMRWTPPPNAAAPNRSRSHPWDRLSRHGDTKRLVETKLPPMVPVEGHQTAPNAFGRSHGRDTSIIPSGELSDAASNAATKRSTRPTLRVIDGDKPLQDSPNPAVANNFGDDELRAAIRKHSDAEGRGSIARLAEQIGLARSTLANFVGGRQPINASAKAALTEILALDNGDVR
jgi:hypothetical protein